MAEQGIATVVQDEPELTLGLAGIEGLGRSSEISSPANAQLIGRISAFITGAAPPGGLTARSP